MADEEPVLSHRPGVGEPGAGMLWAGGTGAGAVLGREPESGKGAVVGGREVLMARYEVLASASETPAGASP